MRIRYYVLPRGDHFDVFRESVHKGQHVLRSRAIEAATTMARLETRFARCPTEVLIEDAGGQFAVGGSFDAPRGDVEPPAALAKAG